MAKTDILKKVISDQLHHIEDENFLSFLGEIISSYSNPDKDKEVLTVEQKEMLKLSEDDIQYGRTISQEDLQKKPSEWDIKSKKLELIQLVLKTEKTTVLEKVKYFLTESDDWWDTLSVEEKKEIELGLQDVEDGNIVDYEEVKKLFRK
jgi:DNA-binding HxlR family transcriptional regulator